MNTVTHSHLLESARMLAGAQTYPEATLYLVPTPIGNLADITLRALQVLQLVDAIACEDTRNTHTLLDRYSIECKVLFALHQHNEQQSAQNVINHLQQGHRVALVTDAGTPAISDPGARAVATVARAGYRIMPLPGASSITTALSAAGIIEGDVLFHGFLPTKTQERTRELKALLSHTCALALLEAPHRIATLANDLATLAADRHVTLARELTKQFEEIVTLEASELTHWLLQRPEREKGEFVCIVHAAPKTLVAETDLTRHDTALQLALAHMPTKAAAQLIAELTGLSKNTLYTRALQLKAPPKSCI